MVQLKPIVTGQHNFGQSLAVMATIGQFVTIAARRGMKLLPMTEVQPGAPSLLPRVDYGRWVVDCPDCDGAELWWPGEDLFMCMSCLNGTVGGKWRKIAVPQQRNLVEAVLMVRPLEAQRFWHRGEVRAGVKWPDESVADLRQENIAHGLPPDISQVIG